MCCRHPSHIYSRPTRMPQRYWPISSFKRAHENGQDCRALCGGMDWEANKAADIKARASSIQPRRLSHAEAHLRIHRRLTSPDSDAAVVSEISCKIAQTEGLTRQRPRWKCLGRGNTFSEDLKRSPSVPTLITTRENIRTHPPHFKAVNKEAPKVQTSLNSLNKVIR